MTRTPPTHSFGAEQSEITVVPEHDEPDCRLNAFSEATDAVFVSSFIISWPLFQFSRASRIIWFECPLCAQINFHAMPTFLLPWLESSLSTRPGLREQV